MLRVSVRKASCRSIRTAASSGTAAATARSLELEVTAVVPLAVSCSTSRRNACARVGTSLRHIPRTAQRSRDGGAMLPFSARSCHIWALHVGGLCGGVMSRTYAGSHRNTGLEALRLRGPFGPQGPEQQRECQSGTTPLVALLAYTCLTPDVACGADHRAGFRQ